MLPPNRLPLGPARHGHQRNCLATAERGIGNPLLQRVKVEGVAVVRQRIVALLAFFGKGKEEKPAQASILTDGWVLMCGREPTGRMNEAFMGRHSADRTGDTECQHAAGCMTPIRFAAVVGGAEMVEPVGEGEKSPAQTRSNTSSILPTSRASMCADGRVRPILWNYTKGLFQSSGVIPKMWYTPPTTELCRHKCLLVGAKKPTNQDR